MAKLIFLLLLYQVVCAVIGSRLGADRDRPVIGAVLGYVFGVIGLLLLVVIAPKPERPRPV